MKSISSYIKESIFDTDIDLGAASASDMYKEILPGNAMSDGDIDYDVDGSTLTITLKRPKTSECRVYWDFLNDWCKMNKISKVIFKFFSHVYDLWFTARHGLAEISNLDIDIEKRGNSPMIYDVILNGIKSISNVKISVESGFNRCKLFMYGYSNPTTKNLNIICGEFVYVTDEGDVDKFFKGVNAITHTDIQKPVRIKLEYNAADKILDTLSKYYIQDNGIYFKDRKKDESDVYPTSLKKLSSLSTNRKRYIRAKDWMESWDMSEQINLDKIFTKSPYAVLGIPDVFNIRLHIKGDWYMCIYKDMFWYEHI